MSLLHRVALCECAALTSAYCDAPAATCLSESVSWSVRLALAVDQAELPSAANYVCSRQSQCNTFTVSA
eukprot:12836-Heterococcus_DN1.PRE.4